MIDISSEKYQLIDGVISQIFSFNPLTGIILYEGLKGNKKRYNGTEPKGIKAGRKIIRYLHREYSYSVVAFRIYHGRWPVLSVDHIDRDPLNNRIDNLREVTVIENALNRSNNKTGVVGVCYVESHNKWQASCGTEPNREKVYFDSFWDAVEWRKDALKRRYGK